MLPDIQPGNTKILYFFNCLLDGMHTNLASGVRLLRSLTNQNSVSIHFWASSSIGTSSLSLIDGSFTKIIFVPASAF